MRRTRTVREFRETMLRRRRIRIERKQKVTRNRPARIITGRSRVRSRRQRDTAAPTSCMCCTDAGFPKFKKFNEYKCSLSKPITICHTIESLGIGGAQVMMLELIAGLNKYYGDYCKNIVCWISTTGKRYDELLYTSYGTSAYICSLKKLSGFCREHQIDIVLHHRISISNDLREHIPRNIPYILINHTWHARERMISFRNCDFYVSVCKFLDSKTEWLPYIHDSRKVIILNGVENDYIEDIPPKKLQGSFNTGRCHRLVPSKFKSDSLRWMSKRLSKYIPGHRHYILGTSKYAKSYCRKYDQCKYVGKVSDRETKMSYLKSFDVYFYETFQHEGASMAILESLACGVPVLCTPLGGTPELIRHKSNGFFCSNRHEFQTRITQLSSSQTDMQELRKSTRKDFDKRLHIRHVACKYVQLFEACRRVKG